MIHVVTSVHNRYAITEKFVECLQAQTCKDIHLLLVDDGSTDGTDKMVKEKLPNTTILYGDGNLWWGGSLHKAYQWLMSNASEEDEVLISNDDTCFDATYLETGRGLLKAYPNTMIAGCAYGLRSGQHLDGIFEHSFLDGTGHLMPPGSESNCASTRSLFLTVAMWRKIGGLHPILLPHYFSDFEFTIRGYRKGLKIRCFEELKFTFDEGATGDNQYDKLTTKKLFGKRSGLNPIYRISFIFLSTPIQYLPGHLCHQAGRYLKKLGLFVTILKKK